MDTLKAILHHLLRAFFGVPKDGFTYPDHHSVRTGLYETTKPYSITVSLIGCDVEITVAVEMWRENDKCLHSGTATQEMWKPTDYFAKDSRARIVVSYVAGGLKYGDKEQAVRFWGPKIKQYWMSDEEIEVWRDKDIAELRRLGLQE